MLVTQTLICTASATLPGVMPTKDHLVWVNPLSASTQSLLWRVVGLGLSEHLLTDLIVETKEGQIWALQAKSVQTSLSGHRRKAAIAEL